MMMKLNANWLTEGLIDFEYKKYLLLAYLQGISSHFNDSRLYPFLSDLVFHYNNLVEFRTNKTLTANTFPKQISKIDFENFKIEYERMIEDDEYMREIESILNFAIPKLKAHLDEGKEIYEYVEDNLSIFPVGVLPLVPDEGYVFIREGGKSTTRVYEYQITIFENAQEKFRGIKTSFITTYSVGLSYTYEHIKRDLIRNLPKLPNPATYAAESEVAFPFDETMLPIVKRRLVKYLSSFSG